MFVLDIWMEIKWRARGNYFYLWNRVTAVKEIPSNIKF